MLQAEGARVGTEPMAQAGDRLQADQAVAVLVWRRQVITAMQRVSYCRTGWLTQAAAAVGVVETAGITLARVALAWCSSGMPCVTNVLLVRILGHPACPRARHV